VTRQLPAAADPDAITRALHAAVVPVSLRALDVTVENDRPIVRFADRLVDLLPDNRSGTVLL